MRTIRNALVAPLVLALLAGLGGTALAQTSGQESTAATGTLEFTSTTGSGGDEVHVHTWTSSDPRLTGTATYTGSWQLYAPPAEDCDDPDRTAPPLYEIVNDGGTWACSGIHAPIPGPDGASNVHMIALTGTGDYAGLFAYILIDWGTDPFTFSALITPNQVPIVPVPQG
jgi:hypothetical protein